MSVKSYKDKNGKKKYYCSVRYVNSAGKRVQHKKEGFSFSSEAKQYEKEFLERINGSTDMSFKSLCEIYLKDCKARLKPTTYRGKKYLFYDKLIPFFKDTAIIDITPAMIRSWQNSSAENIRRSFPDSPIHRPGGDPSVSSLYNGADNDTDG